MMKDNKMKAPYTKDLKTPYANEKAPYGKKLADKKKGKPITVKL